MSGQSYYCGSPLYVRDLIELLQQLPPEAVVIVPSLNRCPGHFIPVDHIYYERGEVHLDGDVSELRHN